jgi:hypothetical protein
VAETPLVLSVNFVEADVQRLRLQPGDVVVLRLPGEVPMVVRQELRDRLKRAFPGNDVLVIDQRHDLSVIGQIPPHGSPWPPAADPRPDHIADTPSPA